MDPKPTIYLGVGIQAALQYVKAHHAAKTYFKLDANNKNTTGRAFTSPAPSLLQGVVWRNDPSLSVSSKELPIDYDTMILSTTRVGYFVDILEGCFRVLQFTSGVLRVVDNGTATLSGLWRFETVGSGKNKVYTECALTLAELKGDEDYFISELSSCCISAATGNKRKASDAAPASSVHAPATPTSSNTVSASIYNGTVTLVHLPQSPVHLLAASVHSWSMARCQERAEAEAAAGRTDNALLMYRASFGKNLAAIRAATTERRLDNAYQAAAGPVIMVPARPALA
jgi:hypothetical protein